MRWQTTAVLAAVLAVLAGFYYVYEIRWGPERARQAAQQQRLWVADVRDVTAVELRRRDDTVRLEREADGWQVRAPVRARGDRGAIEDVLTTLTMARVDREIAAAPARLEEFGLAPPGVEVTLRLRDGRQLGLALGDRSPTGAWVYAREAGKPAVVALSDAVLTAAVRPLADLRDRTVLAVARPDVAGFEIAAADDTIVVERAGDRWRITRPVTLPADEETIRDFLDKLGASRVTEFVAEAPRSLARWGLDRPLRVAIHSGRGETRVTRTLLFGRAAEGDRGVYAMRPGEPSVLLVPRATWQAVPKNVAVLRNRRVVEFQRDRVVRLDVESPGGKVSLVREQDRWRIVAPESLPADQVAVGALLFKLAELRAQGFLSDDATGIARYLGRPRVRVALTEQGGAPLTLLLAPSPERRGGAPSAYAALAGRGPVVLVEAKALEELGRSLTELRDRRLFPDLEPRQVHRVRLRAGERTVVAERRGEADWRLVEPERRAAKSRAVDDLLYVLRALRWQAIAAPAGEAPGRWGLDAPVLEVTLRRGDGSLLGSVAVGRREGDLMWVRTGAGPAIYAVETRQWPELPAVPGAFQD